MNFCMLPKAAIIFFLESSSVLFLRRIEHIAFNLFKSKFKEIESFDSPIEMLSIS